jgi:protein-S-isoprenylcysteine O-methyltransferase Ste14
MSPPCRRLLRATDFVLAGWLLWSAYDVLHDVSRATAHWAIAQGGAEIVLAAWVATRPLPSRVRFDPLSVAAVAVSNWHYLFYDFSVEGPRVAAGIGAALLVAAVYLGVWARLTLRGSFAMLPAIRDLRTRGPYRFVRHPIYLALAITDVGLLLGRPSWGNAGIAVAAVAAHVVRVFREEAIWNRRAAYRTYARATRFRLVPGVF